MKLLEFIKLLFWKPWKVIIGGLIWIFGLYDLFLSQFISNALQTRFPRLADLNEKIGLKWYWWVILFLFVTLVIGIESAYRYIRNLSEPKQIKELGEIRAEGVELRNRGSGLLSLDSVNKWRIEQLHWEENTLVILKNLSTYDYEYFRYLDTFTPSREFPAAISIEHRKYLQVFDEKLKRLGEIIEKYSEVKEINN